MKDALKINMLPNGLRFLIVPIPGAKSATVLTLVKAGTRYETPENNGISHFLEHMVFKGTEEYPTAMDIAVAIDSIGGSFNAFTGKEYTGFYVKTAAQHLDLSMNIVSQLVFNPILPAKELEIERGVILEEIKMYEDEPQIKVDQVFEEVMFLPSTLGWDTLGKPEIIRSITQDTFRDYLDYLYTPDRMMVVVAGGVNETNIPVVTDQLATYFGHEKSKVRFDEITFNFKQSKSQCKVVGKDTEQCHLIFGFRTFGRGNKDRYALSVLNTILGGGMSSRLFTEIREKRGLAYYVGCDADIYKESGFLAMRAGTSPQTAQRVIDLAKVEFDRIKQKSVSAKELRKAKEYIKGHLLLGLENTYEVAAFYAEDVLMEQKFRTVEEVVAGIEAVTAEDVKRLAQELLNEQGGNLAAIGPKSMVETLKI